MPQEITPHAHWNAEYEFYRKIITDEVERLRFNEGFEPIRFHLYQTNEHHLAFIGKAQVAHTRFKVTAHWTRDKDGLRVLSVEILKAP